MARVKGAMMTRKRRNKILKMAKGYWGAKSKHFKMANQQVMKSLTYAYTGRRLKKRDFRRLWITRISAACKLNGMNYSTFMHGLKTAGVTIDRKMLAELASFLVRMWLLKALARLTLPVLVRLNLFLAPLWLFSFGIID